MAITNPNDLADLLVWLDPSFGCYVERASQTTPCTDGASVGSWVARTGQIFVAPSDGQRPIYRTNNGQPYLEFDGSDDTLANAAINFDISNQETWLTTRGTGTNFIDIGDGAQRLYYTGGLTAATTGSLYIKTGAFHETANQFLPRHVFTPHGYTVSPGVAKFLLNGWEGPGISSPWFNTWSATGVKIANGVTVNSPFKGLIQHVVLCDAALSAGDRANLLAWLRTESGTPEYVAQIICCGDSLTDGYHSVNNVVLNGWTGGYEDYSYVNHISLAKRAWKMLNHGVTSKKILTMTADDDTGVDPYVDATTFDHNICVVWAGTNDLALDDTSLATLQTRFSDYCSARTGAGWTVVAVEMMDRADFTSGQRTIRGQFNSWLAGQEGTLFTKLVTLPTQLAGTSPWSTYSTYWDSDNTHLSQLGYQTIAASIQAAVSSIVTTSVGGPGFGIGTGIIGG